MKNKKRNPTRNPRTKENQMISLAFDLAEKKLKDGSASSQLITHFLKLATIREEMEMKRIEADLALANAKIKHMEAQETSAELYENALKAFASYSGVNYDGYEKDNY